MKIGKELILTTLLLACLLGEAFSTHQVPNCKVQRKEDNCCTECNSKFYVAKCSCLGEGIGIPFLAKMNSSFYLLLFVILPNLLLTFCFLKWKKDLCDDIKLRANTERKGDGIIFSDHDVHSKKDDSKNEEDSGSKANAVELSNSQNLEEPLAI